MNDSIRIVLADDQILFVRSLEKVLTLSASDIDVVGIASNGAEAIDLARERQPDIVLMDVRMPGTNGVDATRVIIHERPQTKVIMLTTFDDDEYVRSAISFGASGYLLKDLPPEQLIASIRVARHAPFLISPSIARNLVSTENTMPLDSRDVTREDGHESSEFETLTSREQQILDLLLADMDNATMAEKLFLSERTIRNYVSTIYAKFGVHNRLQLFQELKPHQ